MDEFMSQLVQWLQAHHMTIAWLLMLACGVMGYLLFAGVVASIEDEIRAMRCDIRRDSWKR